MNRERRTFLTRATVASLIGLSIAGAGISTLTIGPFRGTADRRRLRELLAAAEPHLGNLKHIVESHEKALGAYTSSSSRINEFHLLHARDINSGRVIELSDMMITPAEWALLSLWVNT
ncbi:MAG: hypothetical protein H6953_15540 [Chromatiaceae bacterium]|nr:hypothetical protein [Chromatiaceae bacterium]MCP5316160.1 hypothetical protein [Chromatiaceae bacterium]